MGFNMAAALLAASDFDDDLGRSIDDPRQLCAGDVNVGLGCVGIDGRSDPAILIGNIPHPETRARGLPKFALEPHQSETAQ
jgi:hypothetical protein